MNDKKNNDNVRDALKDYKSFYAASCDLNGVWRGKRLPIEQLEKTLAGEMRMPISALALDIWGRDIDDSPLVYATGDQDGLCEPTGRGVLMTTTAQRKSALIPMWMNTEDGEPSPVDPRRILADAVDRAAKMGYRPVTAMEMEFYLVDSTHGMPNAPVSPITKRPLNADSILSIDELEEFQPFFDEVYENADAQNVAVDTTISEAGLGQFEININHCDDPLKSADDAALFKRLIKTIAHAHKFSASFMAKPLEDAAGSGMHVHFSLLNEDGENVFANGTDEGTDILRYAVGGLLGSMIDGGLIWAPHLNSYRRLQTSSHAPTGVSWGYENRTAAIRIPGGDPKAKRIEHRIAGADANPYLVLAAIIHGAMDGIEGKIEPPNPIDGDAYALDLERLPRHWIDGIRVFENSDFIKKNFSETFHEVYGIMKRQEYDELTSTISKLEIEAYMNIV